MRSSRCCRTPSTAAPIRDPSSWTTGRYCREVLFVLHAGIQWGFLPQELSIGSDDLRRRLRDWNQASVRRQLQVVLLAESRGADQSDFSRAAIGTQMCARRGCPSRPGPGRPRPTGPQAPCDRPGARNPAGGPAHRRQPQRHHPTHPATQGDGRADGCREDPRTRPSGRTPTAATTTTPTTTRSGRVRASDRHHSPAHGVTCQLRARGSSVHDKRSHRPAPKACSASGLPVTPPVSVFRGANVIMPAGRVRGRWAPASRSRCR